jgi:hypothetical protein
MDTFIGVIPVYLNSTLPEACDEKTAVDVLQNVVTSELGCLTGWQEVIGRSPLRDGVGMDSYVKTLCRRVHTRDDGKQDAH